MESFTKYAGLDGAVVIVTGGATGIGAAAIEGLTRGLARTLGPRNVRINCVLPGFVRTKRQVNRWLTPELERAILEGQCLKRFFEPEEAADLVAFLASHEARSCTNQVFVIDAGWS